MTTAYDARIPENIDVFTLALAWFLCFLVAFFTVRWIAGRLRRRRGSQIPPSNVPQVIQVYHHHVIEIRREPNWDHSRSDQHSTRDG